MNWDILSIACDTNTAHGDLSRSNVTTMTDFEGSQVLDAKHIGNSHSGVANTLSFRV